jgi:hypothetical protein
MASLNEYDGFEENFAVKTSREEFKFKDNTFTGMFAFGVNRCVAQ